MRAIVLLPVMALVAFAGLLWPLVGLLGYFWFALLRPDVLAYVPGRFPISQILAGIAVVSAVREWPYSFRLFSNPISRWLLLLQIPILASVVFAVDPSLSYEPYWMYLRVIGLPLLIVMVVRTLDDLRWSLLVLGMSVGALGLKFGVWGFLAGGAKFANGYEGLLADNNNLALAFAMTVALCWYLRDIVTSRPLKLTLLAMIFTTTAALIMTHSRGGAVSLGAAFLLILRRSRHKVGIAIVMAMLAAPALFLVRDSYFDRISTIENYQQDNSAVGRIENSKAAIAMWADYPLFGVGFGMDNFVKLSSRYLGRENNLVVHNTYMQMLADSGIFAFLIWVGLLFGTIFWLGRSAKQWRDRDPELAAYPMAIQGALVTFAVGSLFLSRVQFDLYYMLLMCAAAWYGIEQELVAQPEEVSAGDPQMAETVQLS